MKTAMRFTAWIVTMGLVAAVAGVASTAQAKLSTAVRAGPLLLYAERPLTDVNDLNFNRYWGDRVNFVPWNGPKRARLYSAKLALPDGRLLIATMLSDRDDCDVAACPLRLFDGNDMVGEISVCEDMTRHAISADRASLVACGKAHNLAEITAKASAQRSNGETALMHNQSVVNLVRRGGDVEIRYLEPRAGLPKWLKGQLLFKGTEDKQHRFSGTAYTFKANCPPAGYPVSGAIDGNGEIVMAGQAPTRDPKSCAVLGFTTQSRNAKLVFANLPPID
ncbi:MAG: hypothetical protein ABWY82_12470 [Tardiphaga sp.]